MKYVRLFYRSEEVSLLIQRVAHKRRAQDWMFVWRTAEFLFTSAREKAMRRKERKEDEC